jgi:uncharacterized protein YecE (DUF72 family)
MRHRGRIANAAPARETKVDGKIGVLNVQPEHCQPVRVGCASWSIPQDPSLEFKHDRARVFLSRLRDLYGGDVAWEPRHSTWFSAIADELLREFHIARAATDPACVPAAAKPGGYAAFVYFRLHGSPRRYYSAYPDGFLHSIACQMADLARGASVWCVFDNTAAGYAVPNALQLTAKLKAR